MNINPTMNLNFSGKIQYKKIKKLTRFNVPGKEKGTMVVTDIIETGKNEKLTNLTYKIVQKDDKVLEQRSFQNKKGFSAERICAICEEIQKRVKEGFDFLDELLKAQIKGGN